jgi:uncharacterized protein (DUF983 family)
VRPSMLQPALVTFRLVTHIYVTSAVTFSYVQAVPYWVDDESVRPSMLQPALVTFRLVAHVSVTSAVTLQAVPYWVNGESVRSSMLLSLFSRL